MKLLFILIGFLVVLLFLAVLAMLLERYWRDYQAEQAAKKQEGGTADANPLVANINDWVEQLRAMVQPAKQDPELARQFRDWAKQALHEEPLLQSWLLALPENGLGVLTEHIAAFCTEMNFDLKWLVEQRVAVAPELKAAMQGVIVDYCRACQRAVPAQNQAKLFAEYQRLINNSTGKAEQALGRTLYTNLVKKGLVAMPASTELINLTENERQQQALQAIQHAAAKDWAQFAQILQATLVPNEVGAPSRNGYHPPGESALKTEKQSDTQTASQGQEQSASKPK